MLIRISPNSTGINCEGENPEEPTQRLQLLHSVLPYGLNMDAGEAPLWRDLDQVGSLETVRQHLIDVLVVVKEVLAVCEIPTRPREVKERLIEVEAVVIMSEALRCSGKVLILLHLTKPVIVCPSLLIGKNLWKVNHIQFNMHAYYWRHIQMFTCILHQFHQFANFQPALYCYTVSTGICKWMMCTFAPCYLHTNIPVCLSAKVGQMMQNVLLCFFQQTFDSSRIYFKTINWTSSFFYIHRRVAQKSKVHYVSKCLSKRNATSCVIDFLHVNP